MSAERGFTLLELLVVMAVLALVSGLAATAFVGRGARQQDRELATVRRYLEQAHAKAMTSGTAVRMAIGGDSAGDGLAAVTPIFVSTLRLKWSAQAGHEARDGLTFYPDGSATAGVIELDISGRQHRIAIDWAGSITHAPDGI